MKGHLDVRGYIQLDFRGYKNNIQKLQCIFLYTNVFFGNVDSKIYDIHHINEIKNDNSLNNLQCLTRKEHNMITHGGKTRLLNKKWRAVWRIKIENDIEIERIKFNSISELIKIGYDNNSIIKCCRDNTRIYKGYRFEYEDLDGEYWCSLYDECFNRCEVSNYGRIKYNNCVNYGAEDHGYYKKSINKKEYKAHYMICLAFNRLPPSKNHTVDHIDINPKNNHIDNLRWATKNEQTFNRSTTRRVAAYSPITGKLYKSWDTQIEAATELNMKTYTNISEVCSGKNNIANGYIWRYIENNKIEEIIDISNIKIKVKKVQAIDIETGKIYKTWNSQAEAARELNISQANISWVLSGKK